jgi:hypothetical protein
MRHRANCAVEVIGQTKFGVDVNGLDHREAGDDQDSRQRRELAEAPAVELRKHSHGKRHCILLTTSDANCRYPNHNSSM